MNFISKLSADTLLAIGGAYLFFTTGTGLVLAAATPEPVACAEVMSHFDCGQYYFNHDDDPAGPYDLVVARYHFAQAVLDNPQGNELAWYQLGRIDFLEGKFDDAIAKFETQIALFGDDYSNDSHRVHYMLGLTHGYKARRQDAPESWQLAEKHFEEFIRRAPHAPWSRVDLAWIYFSQGKFAEMLPVLEVGLEVAPDNPWLLNMYGLAVMNTSDRKQDALPYFEHAATAAADLTVADWGQAYPGNNPAEWSLGLAEFRATIAKNIDLASS